MRDGVNYKKGDHNELLNFWTFVDGEILAAFLNNQSF